jgi:phosphonate transport system ATP-binding protein
LRPVLAVHGLCKSFGARPALVDVSLTLNCGEFVAVLGPSGSGKTTLFRCITRLMEPDCGEVFVDDTALRGLSGAALAAERRKIGVVFQQFNLIRRLSAIDNVLAARIAVTPLWRVLLRRFTAEDEARAVKVLCNVELADHIDQRADTLSGGQQQRVAIARALAQDSHILLADEPVASLDPETAATVLELLRGLTQKSGLAVLCTLHQPQLAERFADRILVMEKGTLQAPLPRRRQPTSGLQQERAQIMRR